MSRVQWKKKDFLFVCLAKYSVVDMAVAFWRGGVIRIGFGRNLYDTELRDYTLQLTKSKEIINHLFWAVESPSECCGIHLIRSTSGLCRDGM